MIIQPFYDKTTATVSYIITDEVTKKCAILDSVLDYYPESGKTSTQSADALITSIQENGWTLEWILESHLHADHLTAAYYIRQKLGGKIGISAEVVKALHFWLPIFNTSNDTPKDGSQFDKLFQDNENFKIGNLEVQVLNTPGHTPVCVCYKIEDAIFVGDTLFMPSIGTSRADFPGGNAKDLYHSIQRILAFPQETRLFMCHDYPSEGNPAHWETTIREQKKSNVLINDLISEDEYITKRTQRDSTLPVPRLILPALQVNLRAGDLGAPDDNGWQYIKIPLNVL